MCYIIFIVYMKNIIKKYLTEEVNNKRERFFNFIINDYLSDVRFLLVDNAIGEVWVKLPGVSHPNTWMDIYHMKQKEGLPYHVMETFSKYGFEQWSGTPSDFDDVRKIWHEVLRLISIKMREINENRDSYEINQVILYNEPRK